MIFIILRRLLQAVAVLLLVALIAFTIFRFIGDPVESLLGQEATVADRNALIERMGLDDPIPVQYLRFVSNAIQGDFGISYRTAEPVSGLIAERLPATLELALVSAVFGLWNLNRQRPFVSYRRTKYDFVYGFHDPAVLFQYLSYRKERS